MSVFFSMILYLFIFFSSYFCFLNGERIAGKKRYIYICVGLFIPAFFAGARALTVGNDTSGYAVEVLGLCINNRGLSFGEIYRILYSGDTPIELLYVLLQYVISKFTDKLFWSLFVVSYIAWLFIYLATKRLSKNISISVSFTMLLFMIFFYNESLNLMRQTIGAGISLYAFSLYIDKKKVMGAFTFILGVLFHRMSLMMITLWIIYVLVDRYHNRKKNVKYLYIIVIVIGVLLLCSIKSIVFFLVNINAFPPHYVGYVESGYIGIYLNGIIVRIPLMWLLFNNQKRIILDNKLYETFFVVFLIELIMINTIYLSPWAYRIYGYFLYTKIFLLAYIPYKRLSVKSGGIKVSKSGLVIITYALSWWLYYTCYLGVNETIPYVFGLFY